MTEQGFATYDEALAWLFRATDYEQMRRVRYNADTFDLSRMEALLARLGDPRQGQRYLHVAGTKGKGSTATMVSEVLAAAGHRTGLYVSPHVTDLRERISVDGRMIEREAMRDLIGRLRPVVEGKGGREPFAGTALQGASHKGLPTPFSSTFFEILTAAALLHFHDVATDATVLEVGLGGRLDATNVVAPVVCAITSLSMDHMDQLGHTLAEIASEKAGIIKPAVPVVSAPQPPEALAVIERVAAERRAPLHLVGREIEIVAQEYDVRGPRLGERITVRTPRQVHQDVWVALSGSHQAINAAVAIGALELAAAHGLGWDAKALRAGLARAAPHARIEVLGRRPTVINDGAHNPASVAALARVIEDAFPHDRLILVFAAAADKDYPASLAEILPDADHVIFTTSGSPRSATPEELEQAVRRARSLPVDLVPDARAAAARALALAAPDDLVCFTGSFYLAGLIAEWWEKR